MARLVTLLALLLLPAATFAATLEISGTIEIEAALGSAEEAGEQSIDLSSAELRADATLSDHVSGAISLLSEPDVDNGEVNVDEATISYTRGGFMATAGLQYLPFGTFYSHFITAPMTSDLGELHRDALLLTYAFENIAFEAFGYRGEPRNGSLESEQKLDDFGGSIIITTSDATELGATYVSNILDADNGLINATYNSASGLAENSFDSAVPGFSLFYSGIYDGITVEVEYLAATKKYDGEHTPHAWNTEFAASVSDNFELAFRYEKSKHFPAGQPATRYGMATAWGMNQNMDLSFEHLHAKVENGRNYDVTTARWALKF